MLRLALTINTQPALVGLETKLAQAPVHTRLASFSLATKPPVLTIRTELPQVNIDSSQGRAELGLANLFELNRRLCDQSWRDAAFGVEHMAAEGDRLAAFWEPGNTVEEIAAEDVPSPPLDLFAVPAQLLDVEVSLGEVYINYRKGNTAARLGEMPDPRPYEPGYVRVYLRQQAAIDITWQNLDIPT